MKLVICYNYAIAFNLGMTEILSLGIKLKMAMSSGRVQRQEIV